MSKTYTNKSNAARAAKAANGGTLEGLTLQGQEGAWHYEVDTAAIAEDGAAIALERQQEQRMARADRQKAKKPVVVRSAGPGATAILIDPSADKPSFAKAAAAMGEALAKNKAAKKAAAKKAPSLPAKRAGKAAPKGKPAPAPVTTWDAATGAKQGRITGYTIDTDRDERHGVKRRSAGTIGGSLWAIYDKLAKGAPESLAIADVKEHKLVAEYNANKVMIEFYLWRRYHGVRGRGSKQKVDR